MKIQRLVCNNHNAKGFENEVNDLMKDGWRVVPGTSTTALFVVQPEGCYPRIEERYTVVLEKELA